MIFPGEKIQWEKEKQTTVHASDSKINEKFMAGEVRIVTEQARYPLDTITGMVSSGKYNLMPTFQRRHRWDDEKKSRLIESFIMNVPIPPIFLYEVKFSEYEVMDGLQRLSTICDFYEDKFCLTGLKLWPELNGKRYSELPEMVRQGIDRRYLSSIILLQESAKTAQKAQDMKQLVFERINSGGVKLEPQETRNALYNGPMNELCANLARNKYLCALFRIPNEESYSLLDDEQELPDVAERVEKELENNSLYRTMYDVELVLRFFAIRNLEGYQNQFSDFLDKYLIYANKFSSETLKKLSSLFSDTIFFAYQLLGENAFFLWRYRRTKSGSKWGWFTRSTTTVYDPLMFVLSEFLDQKECLLSAVKAIREDLKPFYQKNYDVFEGRNSNRSDIEKRITLYREFFKKYLED